MADLHAIPHQHVLPPRPPGVPAGQWLVGTLREQIVAGQLRPGTRIPASRRLARLLGVARGTVVTAVEQLQAEGYLIGRVGSGVFVSADAGAPAPARRDTTSARDGRRGPAGQRPSTRAGRIAPFVRFEATPRRAFRAHLPAIDLFPLPLWTRVASRRLRRVTARQLVGADPMGYGPLREVVADYLLRSRGVQCVPGQVAIVSGVQEALDCLARLMVRPGGRVCVEDPGYPGAVRAFALNGARIVDTPVDAEGMTVPSPAGRPTLAYVTPSHQFPLGVTMSLGRRLQLLEWARHTGALLVEDDYDSEYRYAGRSLPALQGLDRHGVVAFTGSFSKVLFPALRLGFLVVPPALVDPMSALLSVCGPHTPVLDQAVLCDFIVDGHFHRHVRRMRQVYGQRLAALHAAVRVTMPERLTVSAIEAGLQTAATLSRDLSSEAVAAAAASLGVDVTPLGRYRRARGARTRTGGNELLLGFACVDEREIADGVERLARACDAVTLARRR